MSTKYTKGFRKKAQMKRGKIIGRKPHGTALWYRVSSENSQISIVNKQRVIYAKNINHAFNSEVEEIKRFVEAK